VSEIPERCSRANPPVRAHLPAVRQFQQRRQRAQPTFALLTAERQLPSAANGSPSSVNAWDENASRRKIHSPSPRWSEIEQPQPVGGVEVAIHISKPHRRLGLDVVGRVFSQPTVRTGNRWTPSTRRFGPPCRVGRRALCRLSIGRPRRDCSGAFRRPRCCSRSFKVACALASNWSNIFRCPRSRCGSEDPLLTCAMPWPRFRRAKFLPVWRGLGDRWRVGRGEATTARLSWNRRWSAPTGSPPQIPVFRFTMRCRPQIQLCGSDMKVRPYCWRTRIQSSSHLARDR